jgi:predicted dehydrogenase
MTNFALIGCGYWGKNYVRTMSNIPGMTLKYVVDLNTPKINMPEKTTFTKNIESVLDDATIKGVILAIPTEEHFKIAKEVINAGKNILIEKPFTNKYSDAEKLCEFAEKNKTVLMVGHIFKYNPGILDIKKRIDNNEVGEIRYLESRRVGLGPIRKDASVLWDLATHDIYLSTFLIGKNPISVNCAGRSYNGKIDDIAILNLSFPNDVISTIYVNWAHPKKERTLTVGGTKKAISFDDMVSEKVTIYERSVDFKIDAAADYGEFQATTRDGDILIPRIKISQPLEEELLHFKECVETGKKCFSDGYEGLQTVKILEAAEKSRKNKNIEIKIN